MGRTPVYFFSHGGPNVMEETSHPAHHKLQEIGLEITQKVKPKAVVVFSAHWQGERDVVEVNTAESMNLIYDFYGFPAHYYSMQYPNKGSPELATKLLETFKKKGIKAEGVRRGLDHGVWAGFMVAFDPVKNPLNVPLVQVSLFDTEDPDQHYRLGQSISSLRSEEILIICSGMAVHNLRDMWKAMQLLHPMPYSISFDEALKEAVEQPVEARQKAMAELLKRPDARKAHPTFDHLLPIHVAAGAAGVESGKQIWTMPEGSMAWAQFRFGELA
ncbi:Extradiol aromatic ring-opening dioxygenase [Teratosphaeria nubilosa]|uniref:Extradiol aromatic ring-opening dioxygenase n=1 Tax=Teratosphaeria nubilosa TaxID=161662 RepID=A0A6G1LLR4_9PEZI|nr:Extradiol aromatic ring-opening dioxygenase [Teratosphaeria nubilosa]